MKNLFAIVCFAAASVSYGDPVMFLEPVSITKESVNLTGQTAYGVQWTMVGTLPIYGHYDGGSTYLGEGQFHNFTNVTTFGNSYFTWTNFNVASSGITNIPINQYILVGLDVPLFQPVDTFSTTWLDSSLNPYAAVPQMNLTLAYAANVVQAQVQNDPSWGSLTQAPLSLSNMSTGVSHHKLTLDQMFAGFAGAPGNSTLNGLLSPLNMGPLSLSGNQVGNFAFDQQINPGDYLEMSFDINGPNGMNMHDVIQYQAVVPEPLSCLALGALVLGLACRTRK